MEEFGNSFGEFKRKFGAMRRRALKKKKEGEN